MKLNKATNTTIMKKMIRERNQVISDRNAKRLSKKKQKQNQSALTYSSTIVLVLVLVLVLLLLLDPSISVSAMGLLSTTTKMVVHHGRRHRHRHRYHPHQLYYKSQRREEDEAEEQQFRAPSNDDDDDNNTTEKKSKNKENDTTKSIVTTTKTNNSESESKSESSELMILQEQAAKLRMEAESLQIALQETKNQKLDREIEKVDQWIDDLFLIQQSEPEESTTNKDDDNTNNVDILKNVDQVYQYMTEKRFSAEQIYKIFNRLSDIKMERSQGLTCESRSNCSPFMSLLLDAANKLDCTEKEDNPNKRWNYKIERILQKKLFARDWNIEYIADDEPEQQRRLK